MRVSYEHRISGYRSRYCLAYIACDILKATQKLGTEKANELQKAVAKILNDASGDYDYSARIDNGIFAFCFRHENTTNANKQ